MNPADIIRIKELLPTAMGSDEMREQIAADILRRSVFSARMESARYLSRVREACAEFADGNISAAEARKSLLAELEAMGHSQSDGGGIANPASRQRLRLVIETQRRMASSVAKMDAETPATLAVWPAWELRRFERRKAPRGDWMQRWQSAAESVGYEGVARHTARMVALKSSPIWQALGDGAGGFRDTLGNPYPPFAYSSGLAWADVDADECRELGLDPSGNAEKPPKASLSPDNAELLAAAKAAGFDIGKGLA